MIKLFRVSGSVAVAALVAVGISPPFRVPAATAQEAAAIQAFPAVDVSKLTPEQRAQFEAMKARGPQPAQGGPQPNAEKKPEGGGKKPDGDKGEKKEEDSKTIKRPTEPPKANPEKLKAKPDKDGMVQFSFYGQPWTEVLQWYAEVAGCSLDWQEMPADFLNLQTQRRYTIPETRDLLNSRLLSRGFTMIRQGDVLSVVKLDKIDPSLVPRIEPDDLEEHLPFDFGRVRFTLPDDMDPAKAVDDVKILLNPSAKVIPLLASKQLMVIDAVSNLRDVRDLLYSQQLAQESDIRPKQFQIRYRRADYVAEQVMVALGLDPNNRKVPMEVQMAQQQQRMQMMQQQMQQQQQQGGKPPAVMKPDAPQVHIAVDVRRNTMSVNAPPKEMRMIERIIQQFDVPEHGEMAEAGASGALTLERYQTVTVDPEAVISALKEIGNLNPLTQLKSDSGSKTIFATATPEDHETIKRMVGKLDGTGRGLRVVWLSRRTRADEVAGTVQALMVGEKKKEDNNRSRYFFYDPWDRNDEKEEPDTGFRIQADVENNRLLLWCNDSEYGEVTTMLEQLGAIASATGKNPNTWRVLETRDPKQTAELVERLRQSWNGKNPLNIQVAPQEAQPPAEEKGPAKPAEEKAVEVEDADRLTHAPDLGRRGPHFWLAQFAAEKPTSEKDKAEAASAKAPAESPAPATADGPAPAINITVTPDGRILVSSQDVAALDQIEDLLNELEPKQQEFAVFKLNNSRAVDVHYNLKEYFHDELADDDEGGGFYSFFNEDSDKDSTTLGKRRKMRFIWDPDSNTILVQNASPAQLETIRKLIQIYDQPMGEVTRRTEIIQIRYSKANDIASALKEVYRDLLSSKDKEFQGQRGEGDRRTRTETYYRFYGGSNNDNKKTAGVKMAFEGALSIGVDQVSNSLIISAEEQIFVNVREIVRMLDEEAKPDTVVQVHQIEGSISATELRKALATALSNPWPGGKPENAAGSNQGGRQGGDNNGRGGDGDRRRGRDRDRGDRGRDND